MLLKRLETFQTFDQSDVLTKIQKDRNTKRQKDKKTKREFNIVMSGQFRTLAMF